MKRRYKILGGLAAVLAVLLLALGLVLSHEGECRPAPVVADGAATMRAVIHRCYGGTEVLELVTVEKPVPAADRVLVRVRASAVNPYDWHFLTGSPYLMRLEIGIGAPADGRVGVDFAGTVEAVGSAVTTFAPGDRVFGGASGAFAEYVTVRQDGSIAKIPEGVGFEDAATVGIAGITALQALRDHAGVEPGDRVLINGASGGVGSFAVQMAKALGAEVTGVASARHLETLRALGADHVIDYREQRYIDSDERWDAVIDNVGNFSPRQVAGVLEDDGVLVLVGGPKGDWVAPFVRPVQAMLWSPFTKPRLGMMLGDMRQADFEIIGEMLADGRVRAVIDERFPLAQAAAAIERWQNGDGAGKVIVTVP